MGRPNTTKLQKSDTENSINSPESAVSIVNVENGTATVAGKKFHFIGAGGVGMSGLAQLLIKNHALVTGSDQDQTAVTDRLCEWGADIKIGHNEKHLDPAADAVVISAAIKEDNPELKLARNKGLKIYKYAQMLGQLCNCYEGVAIAGTHGKSTTSGWLAYCLKQAGIDANFIIGADIIQLGGSSGVGESKYFIAEACEYDRSFLNLKPRIGCILNIEQDHLDYYKDEEQIVDAFCDFALGVKPNGVLIANGTDSNVAKVISKLTADVRCEIFGLDRNCDFYADNIELNDGFYTFDSYHNGTLLGKTRISLPGTHNILNALAVVAMAINIGLDPGQVLALLPGFTGIDRRLMLKAQVGQITVLDDYAHHPTEIRASLAAIRERYEPKRIFCIFQPHQYSRTRFLLNDFSESFKLADVTIVPEIYFVRDSQAAKKEVNAQILVERIRNNGTEALFIDGFDQICDYLKDNVTAGDLVVTMGAGDIWKVADEYIQRLRENS
ncbi:MAG: UDP-N-acetylmuramate--L-alanine ligase [Planctomycetota bacterium]|jgi:UDP-N-acetylmuramate--alanine ligase